MAKFKVGDVVIVRKDLVPGNMYGYTNFVDSMSYLKGKCVHIKRVIEYDGYRLLEDNKHLWTDEMFEPVVKDPVLRVDGIITDLINDNKSLFDKVEFRYEIKSKKPILDDVEKRYLSDVIRPFRDKVKYIKKDSSDCAGNEYICIILNEDNLGFLPDFKKDTMYKGMKPGKRYTLKELGL